MVGAITAVGIRVAGQRDGDGRGRVASGTCAGATSGGGLVPPMDTTARSACASAAGSTFPRRSARRMIPWQANRLKKYRGRCDPLVSKMSHNKEATPPLGDSEMLRVQDPPGEAIPALAKRPEDDFKSQSSVSRQDTGDIFPEEPPGTDAASQSRELQGEVSPGVVETATVAGDTEALARGSSDQKVN